MNRSFKYRILSLLVLVFIIAFSLCLGIFVYPDYIKGNVAYWVFKGIALFWLVLECITIFLPKAGFGKFLPLTILGVVAQFVPIAVKYTYDPNAEKMVTGQLVSVFICAFVMFVLIAVGLLWSFSNKTFRDDEDRAGHSSNYKGK